MTTLLDRSVSRAIREAAHPLAGSSQDFEPLMARIGDARFVLIGEASHGTHEFYRIRAAITKELFTKSAYRTLRSTSASPPMQWRALNRHACSAPSG